MPTYTQNNPEYYGYTIGQNVAPFIGKCIEATGVCELSEGTHILGRNDNNWNTGQPTSDSIITWGWGSRKGNVSIVGKGRDKTTIKFVDNVNSRYLFGNVADYVFMLQTKYDESCDNVVINGITWDGNYENNRSTSTINGIRIRGENTKILNCRFQNFGVGGNQSSECFELSLSTVKPAGVGAKVINNIFTSPGRKRNSPSGFVPEHTLVGVSGNSSIVANNMFINYPFDVNTQQSPLHAVTLSDASNSKVWNNVLKNFQGCFLYMDSWRNDNVVVQNNNCSNIWYFVQLTCQKWDNPDQISFNSNFDISNNIVSLGIGQAYYEWDKPGNVTGFVGYINAPDVDHTKYPGFQNVNIHDNTVTLGYMLNNGTYTESTKLICYYGNPVTEDKIKLYNNKFTSSIPQGLIGKIKSAISGIF